MISEEKGGTLWVRRNCFLENVKKYIRPQTDPVAVHLAYGDETPPEGAIMPMDKYGYPLTICQGRQLCATLGQTLVFRQEDHACPPALCAFGYLPTENLLAGKVAMPGYAGDRGGRTQDRGRQRPARQGAQLHLAGAL